MKLTVLKWLFDSSISLIGRTIELLFRIILCILPMGAFLLLIQLRSKASKVSNISVYTNDESIWQHIFPGFILIAINPNSLKNSYNSTKNNFQKWIEENKYILAFLFMSLISALVIWIGR